MSRFVKVEPPTVYAKGSLELGDKVTCAGCDAEHTILSARKDERIDWGLSGLHQVRLAKTAPVAAFACTTQNGYEASKRCLARALKRMKRCAGCGRGPGDPHPKPGTWKDRKFPAVEPGKLCKWCQDALAAGNAALASRGEVTWRALVTGDLFGLVPRGQEGDLPGEAFDALRKAAVLLAKLAAGANLRSAACRWESPVDNSEPPTVPRETRHEWHSSDEPLAEMDDATAEILTELGAAVGRAITLAQEESHNNGESILQALMRANVDSDPYEGLV